MFSRSKRILFYAASAVIFFTAGWACNKQQTKAALGMDEVVAVVDGQKITFGDWMRQLDLLRVSGSVSVDPDSAEAVKAVLDSLIDQQLVLGAAKKADYQNAAYDQNLKASLLDAGNKIKDIKEKLIRDMDTVKRIEKNYEEPFKKMLLAREFAKSQVNSVVVTEKDLRDWYAQYSEQARRAGQKLPPYGPQVGAKIKSSVQAEKFLTNLRATGQIVPKKDMIDKYLNTLSMSRQLLDSKEKEVSPADAKKATK